MFPPPSLRRQRKRKIDLKIALCAPTDIHSLARASGHSCEGVVSGLGSTATTPLIIEFLRRGHEVTVYTLSRSLLTEQLYHWGNLRIFVGPYRLRHLARNFYRPEINYLIRVIKADAPRLVHAHWTYEFALGAVKSGFPTVTTIHDLPWHVLMHFRNPHRFVRLLMAYQVALRGEHFTAVSTDAASHFRRYFKRKANITVIPNGLPDSVFQMSEQPKPRTAPTITFATVLQGWNRLKNARAALTAFGIVHRQFPNARFTMFGSDYEPGGPAQQWAFQHGLDANVSFLGKLPHMELISRLNNEIDVLVHPSLNESFSITALEAMALKKPVIAGKDTNGVREVLGFGKNGILVDITNPPEIANAMIRLAHDKPYRDHMALSGYNRASSLYRLDAVVSQYEALYSSILQA